MNEKYLPISDLKSLKPDIVINALEKIDFSLENSDISIDYPELYHHLSILFSHNHYKIRKYALIIAQKVIQLNEETFPEILDTFPTILSCLISTNKEIVKISDQFVQLIINIFDVQEWWPIFEKTITTTHYLPFKINLLKYSLPFSNELPVKPICKLLEDPAIQVQKLAMEILEEMDPERLKEAIVQAKVLGNIRPTNEQLQQISNIVQLPPNYKITLSPIEFPKSNSKSSQTKKIEQNKQIIDSNKDNDNNNNDNQIINEINIEKDELKEIAFDQQTVSSRSSKRSFSIQNGDSISLNKVELESKNKFLKKNKELDENQSEMNSINNQTKINPKRTIKPSIKNIQTDENKNEDKRISRQNQNLLFQKGKKVNQKPKQPDQQPPEIINNKETIGHLPKVKKEPTISFKLKNLSDLTLDNKINYLNLIDKSTEKGNFIYPADRILDCVLTAVFPVNQRVFPLLVKIISNLIVHNPEIALPFLHDILNFIIYSQGIFLENDERFNNLVDTLILEVNGNEIVTHCLEIVNSSKRPLHLEHFLGYLFTRESDLKLKKQQFFGILDYLFHRSVVNIQNKQKTKQTEKFQQVSKQSEKLKFFLAQSQPNLFKEWIYHQAYQDQPQLLLYLKTAPQTSPLIKQITKRVQKEEKQSSDQDLDPIKIALSEMKKGQDGDIQLIVSCFNQCDPETVQISRVFQSLLYYLSVLGDKFIEEQNDNLNSICTSIFFSPSLFSVFNNPDKISPSIIRGFSCFIWHCSIDVLKGSDSYYPQLYQVYKKSNGEQRQELCIIFLAIQKFTNTSILSIKGIHPKHYEIIRSTLSSFSAFVNEH